MNNKLVLEEYMVESQEKCKEALELLNTIDFLIESQSYENLAINMSKIKALMHCVDFEINSAIDSTEKALNVIYKCDGSVTD